MWIPELWCFAQVLLLFLPDHKLLRHQVNMTSRAVTMLRCEQCQYQTHSEVRLREHVASHRQERRELCPLCGKAFVLRNTLAQHLRWKHSDERIQCPFCVYQAPMKKQLTVHIRTMHTHRDVKPFQCGYCSYTCRSSQNTRKHVQLAHKGQPVKWIKLQKITAADVDEAVAQALRARQEDGARQGQGQVADYYQAAREGYGKAGEPHPYPVAREVKSVQASMVPRRVTETRNLKGQIILPAVTEEESQNLVATQNLTVIALKSDCLSTPTTAALPEPAASLPAPPISTQPESVTILQDSSYMLGDQVSFVMEIEERQTLVDSLNYQLPTTSSLAPAQSVEIPVPAQHILYDTHGYSYPSYLPTGTEQQVALVYQQLEPPQSTAATGQSFQ